MSDTVSGRVPSAPGFDPSRDEKFIVPWTPTRAMWGGLPRDLMMWMDMETRFTPASLLRHLERCGRDVPSWLRDEPEMKALDHSMSKGTRATLVYQAMLWERRQELLCEMTRLGEDFERDSVEHPKSAQDQGSEG